MLRTFLVLLFLAACGVYFHQNNAHTTPQAQTQAPTGAGTALDDSSLQALKKVLPAQLFEKEVQPAIEQNKRGGLNSEQLSQLLERLKDMSRELGGKASQAAGDAAKHIEQALPQEKSMDAKGSGAASEFAQKAGESVKASLPVLKELSGELLSGMVAVLSQILSSAAELLKK